MILRHKLWGMAALILALDAEAKTVRICIDEVDAFPMSFVRDGKIQGVYVDLAKEPLEALGFRVEFVALPWNRCVNHELKSGRMTSALSAAWTKERAEYAMYPENAETDGPACRSPQALVCNGPVLLVPSSSRYEFKGDLQSIPQPLRITHGYAQIDEYKKRGLKIDSGPDDEKNLAKLLRDGTGSVLMWLGVVKQLERDERYRGKFRVVPGFSDLSDGFLPFSKRGAVLPAEATKIWEELAKRNADPAYFSRVAARYDGVAVEGGQKKP